MIPPLRKSLKGCRAHKIAALDSESGAHVPLNQSNLLLGGSGIRKAAFSDQRDTEIFMIPLLEGSEVSQLALESRACGLLETSTELLNESATRVWNPEDPTEFNTWPAGTEPGHSRDVFIRSWWQTVLVIFTWTHPAWFPSTFAVLMYFVLPLDALITFWKYL